MALGGRDYVQSLCGWARNFGIRTNLKNKEMTSGFFF